MIKNYPKLNELINALDPSLIDAQSNVQSLCGTNQNYVDLTAEKFKGDHANRQMYDHEQSVNIYKNSLIWLCATFKTDEKEFRRSCMRDLEVKDGAKVLIVSCGLGEDVRVAVELVGESGFVHAQDLSGFFVRYAAENMCYENAFFTVSNALSLPYRNDYFDGVFHFGGINLFGDTESAIGEMNRVCRIGGRVVFGDESVAPHLRNTDYGRMFIENNSLWNASLPLQYLPKFANDIVIRYLLGNCFYLIGFRKGNAYPDVDIDVEHVGYRGGSVRKRYLGKIEGIDPLLKAKLYEFAKANNISVSRVLEDLIRPL